MDEKKDETLFGWIHVSDIHFGHGDASHRWDQALVLDELAEDIPAAMKLGAPKPDAIMVTGDIAFSGAGRSKDEYTNAEKWLRRLGSKVGLGTDRIFLVPGNHDVNRGLDASLTVASVVDELRSGAMHLDMALLDKGARSILRDRMEGYLTLAERFSPGCTSSPPPPEQAGSWVHRLDGRGGLKVRLCGLNTALLSRDDTDQGKLQLGKQQLNMALVPGAAPGELVVVLSHHPLREWLSDGKRAEEWVHSRAHLHLSGHVHEAETHETREGAGGHFVNVTAGASHGEMVQDAWVAASHGYNFAAVVRGAGDKLLLRVWPRRWAEKSKSFRVDTDSVRDGERYAQHELRATLPALSAEAAAPAAIAAAPADAPPVATHLPVAAPPPPTTLKPLPIPVGPLPTFISYAPAPDDKAALARLEVHLKQLKRDRFIDAWSTAQVGGGSDVRQARSKHLQEARIILLLISADYLGSDECYDVEMKTAIARHEAGEARVIPILLRKCDFKKAPFARLQMLPRFQWEKGEAARPVLAFDDPEDAFAEITDEIRGEVEALRAKV